MIPFPTPSHRPLYLTGRISCWEPQQCGKQSHRGAVLWLKPSWGARPGLLPSPVPCWDGNHGANQAEQRQNQQELPGLGRINQFGSFPYHQLLSPAACWKGWGAWAASAELGRWQDTARLAVKNQGFIMAQKSDGNQSKIPAACSNWIQLPQRCFVRRNSFVGWIKPLQQNHRNRVHIGISIWLLFFGLWDNLHAEKSEFIQKLNRAGQSLSSCQ